jgi:hypothetical protein
MPAPAARRATKTRRRSSTAAATADPPPSRGGGSAASANAAIDPERIARLAHSYWEARGCQGGSPEEDWLRAERQLQAGN